VIVWAGPDGDLAWGSADLPATDDDGHGASFGAWLAASSARWWPAAVRPGH
jgi:hypothetical protein